MSLLEKNQGLYDSTKRYSFTNITAEDFTSAWGGSPITVKAGETVKLNEFLANKLTTELVDKIMIGNAKMDEVKYYEKNPNTEPNRYRAANMMGVPAARKVWEDKIAQRLPDEKDTAQMQIERANMKAKLEKDMSTEKSTDPVSVPTSLEEFAELKK